MTLDEIIIDSALRSKLKGLVSSGRVPHAMMFIENDGGGGFAVVQAFLEELFGESERHLLSKMMHPDVYYLFPVSSGEVYKAADATCSNYFGLFSSAVLANPYITKQGLGAKMGVGLKGNLGIGVKEVERIIPKISYMPIRASKKAVVVYLPEHFNQESANKLLKSVEEPPDNTFFLFITQDESKVLKTITSRCSRFRIPPLSVTQERLVREKYMTADAREQVDLFFLLATKIFSGITEKNLVSCLDAYEQVEKMSNREDKKSFCRYLGNVLRNIFLLQQGFTNLVDLRPEEREYFEVVSKKIKKSFSRKAIDELGTAIYYLERNVASGMVFCDLILKFYKLA